MAIITGKLTDFTRQAMSSSIVNYQPVLEFTPSANGVKDLGSVLYATRTVSVIPEMSTGNWSVDLESTDFLRPGIFYTVAIRWLDAAGNFVSVDYVPGRLYVPAAGGLFTDVFRVGANPLMVWVTDSSAIPAEAVPQDLLLDPITGDLYRVS